MLSIILVVKLIKPFSFTFRIGNIHVQYLEKIILSSATVERVKYLCCSEMIALL